MTNRRTAANNILFPGTKIKIVGQTPGPRGIRRYIIRDTGPALADGHFDLWTNSCDTALAFGKRRIKWRFGW